MIIKGMIKRAMDYAIYCHESTGHQYDNKPYSVHLQMVFDTANNFIHLIPENEREDVLAACWVHDVIEDCRQTYNDIKERTNGRVADLAYALTNEKGKTRKERAGDKYYDGIRKTPYATFIKVCDRIANYEYSIQTGSKIAEMYEKEMDDFLSKLYDHKYDDMFYYLTNNIKNLK